MSRFLYIHAKRTWRKWLLASSSSSHHYRFSCSSSPSSSAVIALTDQVVDKYRNAWEIPSGVFVLQALISRNSEYSAARAVLKQSCRGLKRCEGHQSLQLLKGPPQRTLANEGRSHFSSFAAEAQES